VGRATLSVNSPVCFVLVATCLLVLPLGVSWADRPPDKNVSDGPVLFPAVSDTVVLQLTEEIGRIGNEDLTPRVRVYGDGRVLVHYPVYMKKAGDYVLQLTARELQALQSLAVEKGAPYFDKNKANAEKQVAKKNREASGIFTHSSDDSITIIETTVQVPAKSGGGLEEVKTRASWYGLKHDARQYPEAESLTELAEVEAALSALAERPDLQRIEEDAS
jgi:hypothetical protein